MDPDLLNQAINDAKIVRQQALNNAKKALEDAFSDKFAAMFGGFSYTTNNEGVIRYTIQTPEGVDNVYDDIEKNGYVILDEDEDGNWIEAIPPQRLNENVNGDTLTNELAKDIQQEIDKEIIDMLVEASKNGKV